MTENNYSRSLRIKNILLVICGWFFLLIGIIGVLLPVIPTAILIFAAAGCFAKSSPNLYNWLVNNRFIGKYIIRFHQEKDIPMSVKIASILMLNVSISYTAIYIIRNYYLKIFLFLTALSVTLFILSIKNKKQQPGLIQAEIK